MDDLEKNTVKWNLYGVGVYYGGKLQFIVDAQGYSYARYVGLVDNIPCIRIALSVYNKLQFPTVVHSYAI